MAEVLDGKKPSPRRSAPRSPPESPRLKEQGRSVRLDVILVGDDPASATYVRLKERDCAEVGIESRVHRFTGEAEQEEVADLVRRLNEELAVSGFFVQTPRG